MGEGVGVDDDPPGDPGVGEPVEDEDTQESSPASTVRCRKLFKGLQSLMYKMSHHGAPCFSVLGVHDGEVERGSLFEVDYPLGN